MKRLFGTLALLFASIAHLQAVTIPTVPVGNPGNANDPLAYDPNHSNLYGGVSYEYRIGTTEVTNAQYAEFLNAKAASDPLALYNTGMGSGVRGGITRSGSDGSYSYAVKPNMDNKPVNYVSWFDATRFINWLNNGQGNGDTESGAYTLLGGTATPSNGDNITRKAGATWFLPTDNEWYKAAYYQPAAQGGDVDNYWRYTGASNSLPTVATANSVGDISNPGANVANTNRVSNWNGTQDGNVTTVGSAGPLSQTFYGTFDQGGNVWEWNETLVGSNRALRGGSFNLSPFFLQSTYRANADPAFEEGADSEGFRVATVPEPSTYALAAMGLVSLLAVRRRKH